MMRISLIQPGPVPAEERDVKYRFLKGKPYFGGELKKEDFGYEFKTHLVVTNDLNPIAFDYDNKIMTVYVETHLSEVIMSACIGKNLSDIMDLPGDDGVKILSIDTIEKRSETNRIMNMPLLGPDRKILAFHTTMPGKIDIEFEPVYFATNRTISYLEMPDEI